MKTVPLKSADFSEVRSEKEKMTKNVVFHYARILLALCTTLLLGLLEDFLVKSPACSEILSNWTMVGTN